MSNENDEFPDIHNPHDKLFKLVFRKEENLLDFMRNNLPFAILKHLDLTSLEIVPGTYLDNDIPLIPIIPVLFCHAGEKWEYRPFSSLFQRVPEIFLEFVPDFRYILKDISGSSFREIKGGLVVRLAQILMRATTAGELEERLPEILELLRQLAALDSGLYWLEIFIRYILDAGDVGYAGLTAVFRENKFSAGEKVMASTTEQLLKQGREQGREEGREEEKLETARRMMKKGLPVTDILEITGLSAEKLQNAGLIDP